MTIRLTRRAALGSAAAAAAATLAAPRIVRAAGVPMSFQFDWKFNAQFAGVFKAIDAGLYAGAGIDMTPRPWADGVNVVADVAEGRADFACAEQNLIIAAQAEGAPVRAVATMFQASPYGLMTVPGGTLTGLSDLSGKTVGVHVDGVKIMAMVMGVSGISDITVTEIPYADKFARVQSGELAAVQCYVIDEPIGVAKAIGAEPVVLKLSDAGLVSTAQTIVVSERMLADSPDMVRAAMAATFAGWAQTLADKPGTAAMVVEKFVEPGSSYADVAYQTRTLELLEPYVMAGGTPGRIDPATWARAAQLMLDYGIVTALPDMGASLAEGFV
jgi:ABC-type nitrate/sulfonate/bicarbonate transport system substrate-binding protein